MFVLFKYTYDKFHGNFIRRAKKNLQILNKEKAVTLFNKANVQF